MEMHAALQAHIHSQVVDAAIRADSRVCACYVSGHRVPHEGRSLNRVQIIHFDSVLALNGFCHSQQLTAGQRQCVDRRIVCEACMQPDSHNLRAVTIVIARLPAKLLQYRWHCWVLTPAPEQQGLV